MDTDYLAALTTTATAEAGMALGRTLVRKGWLPACR